MLQLQNSALEYPALQHWSSVSSSILSSAPWAAYSRTEQIVFQNFLHSQIEYKFVNLLNKWDFENAFPLLCDYEQKNIPTHKYEQELTKIFWEDKLFQIKNFRVNTSFPIDTEKKEMTEKWFLIFSIAFTSCWIKPPDQYVTSIFSLYYLINKNSNFSIVAK